MIELPNRSMTSGSYRVKAEDIRLSMAGIPEQQVAVWHTHPEGLIGPSTQDMTHRPDDDVPMLVVALTAEGPIPTWF